ncbi:MAG: hypothetical protein HC763_27145 [Hydrococcus sp. CRU_1_1]|nr:hypothetical protein [Hydrococcus sp. CRU_1_1]
MSVKTKLYVILISGCVIAACELNSSQAATLTRDSRLDYLNTTNTSNSSGSDLVGDIEQGAGDVSDFFGEIDSELSELEQFYSESLGEITGTIGKVMSLFNRVVSPIQGLFADAQEMAATIVRLINLPSTLGSWWEQMLNSVTGELDPCLSEFSFESFIEPGWCFGGASGSEAPDPNGDENNPPDEDNPNLPPFPSAPRKSTGDILKSSVGAAGIPVPSKVRSEIQRTVDTTGGNNMFEINPIVARHYALNMAERATARLSAEAVLGETGQKKLVEESKGISEAVTNSMGTAKSAQALDVTQDVMKQMIQVQATEALLAGNSATSLQQMRVDNAMSHLMLSNMSRTLDETARERRIDRTLSLQKVIKSTSPLGLY